MNHKRILSVLLPILFVTSLMVPLLTISTTSTVSANPSWWDTSWAYRRTITISPLNPENFQIKVVIPSSIPTSEYASIRFLENETTGVLPYWIESSEGVYDNNYMNIAWVKRLENNDNTIFMYYHKTGATSAENGDNVFLFFDGFVGSSVDSNKWATTEGNVSVSSNVLHLWANGKIEHGESKGLTTDEESTRRIIETRMKNATNQRGGLLISGSSWDHEETACIFTKGGGEYRFWSKNYPGTQDGGYLSQQNHLQDVYYILRVDLYGDSKDKSKTHFYWGNDNANYRALVEESQELTNDWTPPGDHVDKYSLRAWDSPSSYYFDWIFVRRYASTEPVATVGAEAGHRGVSVSITPSLQNGWNGDNLVYTVTVTNTGTDNLADNYTITLSDNLNWATLISSSDLIISEYIEGTSYNKAIEIYNGTSSPVDLSGYRLELYSNGSLPLGNQTKVLFGTLKPGDVFVGCHGTANAAIKAVADWIDNTNGVINWNGDDGIRLARVSDNATIDSIGQLLVDPGTSWPGGGMDQTQVRKANVTWGDTNFNDAFTFATEWNTYAVDTTTYLGWHRVLGPITRQLNPGENWTSTIIVNVAAPGCTTDNIKVTATSVGDNTISSSATAQAHSAVAGVSESISPSSENGLPGNTLDYTVTVTNNGDLPDNIQLTKGDTNGWSVSLDNTSFLNVNTGDNRTTTLHVVLPSASGGQSDNAWVQAASAHDSNAKDNKSVLANATLIEGVTVSISPSSQSGANGAVLTYNVTITNTGNANDTYTLENADNSGWTLGLSNTTVGPLAPSASDNSTTLSVTIPTLAIGATIDNVIVTATGGASASASATAQVDISRSVSVSISPSLRLGENGATVTYTVTVTNTGNVSDTYTLDNTDTAGWVKSLSNTSVGPLAAFGGSDSSTILSVTIPTSAISGDEDNITVTANGTGVSDSDVVTARCEIAIVRSVSVDIAPASNNGANGVTLTYIVTVTNNGNVADNYALDNTDDAGWDLSLDNILLEIPAGGSLGSTLSVTIPSNAIGGTVDNVTVTATCQENTSVTGSDVATATVDIAKSVDVSIAPLSQSGNNGDTLNYTVTVTNNGNVADSFTLDNTDTLGWALSLSSTVVGPLAAFGGSDSSVTLSVTIPGNAIGGTTDNVTVTATADDPASGSGSCLAQVNTLTAVSISISPPSQNGNDGALLTYTVTINNTGNVSDTYALSASDDAGWSPSVPASKTVAAFSSDNVTLSVTIPGNAIGGTTDNITVTAVGTGDNSSAGCTATVNITRTVSVSIAPGSQSGANGATLNYTVTVNNTGNVADTYALDNVDTKGWALSLSSASVAVPAFSSDATTTLSVTIPISAIGGTIDNVTVTANGTGDSGSNSCLAQVNVVRTVSVSTSPSDKTGWVGENLTFGVTVTNTGNVFDNYQLSLADTLPWAAGWDAPSQVYGITFGATDNHFKDYLDTYVREYTPTTSYWGRYNMYVGVENNAGNYTSEIALTQWKLSDFLPVGAVVDSAKIWMVGTYGPSHNPGNVADNTWLEAWSVTDDTWSGLYDNVTWSTRPALSTLQDNILWIASVWVGQQYWWSVNVTPTVQSEWAGDKVVSVALAGNGIGATDGAPGNNGWFNTRDNHTQGTPAPYPDNYYRSPWMQVSYHIVGASIENSVSLGPGDNWTGTVWVVVGGTMGQIDDKMVTATSMINGLVTDSSTSYAHNAVGGVSVSIAPTSQSGSIGSTLDYTVTVVNTGDLTDNITLTKGDTQGWTTSLDNTLFSDVPSGENRSTTLHVTLNGAGTDNVTVTATEQGAGQTGSDSATAVSTGVVYSMNLFAGWNLVCFPVDNSPTTPSGLFDNMTYLTDYIIYRWTAPAGPYVLVGVSDVLKDNFGYWVWINTNKTLTWSGTQPTSRNVYLVPGWNMVGFPIDNASSTPSNKFSGLTYLTNYIIYSWTAPAGPYVLQSVGTPFKDNTGYWVWIDQPWTVTVP